MTHQERLAIIKANSKLKLLWYFVLIFLAINLVVVVYTIFMVLNTINVSGSAMTTSFLLLSLAPIIAITLLQLWLLWGAYRLEGWITFWLWLAIVGTLLSFNIYALILNIAALVVYKMILKNIKKLEQVGTPAPIINQMPGNQANTTAPNQNNPQPPQQ